MNFPSHHPNVSPSVVASRVVIVVRMGARAVCLALAGPREVRALAVGFPALLSFLTISLMGIHLHGPLIMDSTLFFCPLCE